MGRSTRGGDLPTIYDVARAAGVAPSTVSRAFSRPGRVKSETAERIRAVAAELGYRTNPMARALPTGRTAMIAMIISDVTNPFYFEIIRGAQAAAAEAGYTILLTDAQESVQLEREAVDRLLPTVEGLVLGTSRMPDPAIRMAAKQRPTVVLNRAVADVPSVVPDNAHGTRRAVEHLHVLGHSSLTYVAGPEASWADGMRWRSLRETAQALDMRVRRVGPCVPTVAAGTAATAMVLEAQPSAVLAYNDLLAIGLMRGLASAGVQVPCDVSVVGFDNIFGSDFCTPSLTTVGSPLRALGVSAVQYLVVQMRGARPHTGDPLMLPTRLVVRGSTARRGRAYRSRKSTSPARGSTSVSASASNAATSTSAGSR